MDAAWYGLLSGYRDWIAKRPSFLEIRPGLSLFMEFKLGKKGYFASINPMSVPISQWQSWSTGHDAKKPECKVVIVHE